MAERRERAPVPSWAVIRVDFIERARKDAERRHMELGRYLEEILDLHWLEQAKEERVYLSTRPSINDKDPFIYSPVLKNGDLKDMRKGAVKVLTHVEDDETAA